MPVILMEKDPFSEIDVVTQDPGTQSNVRRPLLGIALKKEDFCTISLYHSSGKIIAMQDSSAPNGLGTENHNFLIQNVTESRQEKMQLMETFGDDFVFFYGEKAKVYNISGILLNSKNFNWKSEWLQNYERYLRGTRCVENKTLVYITYDYNLVSGYIFNTATTTLAEPYQDLVAFSFQVLVREHTILSQPGVITQTTEAPYNETGERVYPEYIAGPRTTDTVYIIDSVTGEVVAVSNSNLPADLGNSDALPGSINASGGTQLATASWITNVGGQFMRPDVALTYIDAANAAALSGTDARSARLAQRDSPETFPLSARTDQVASLSKVLGTGVANGGIISSSSPEV